MARQSRTPWWAQDASETCHACTHRYVYHVELRCVACDRGLCMHCAVIERISREAWCPECHAEQED